MKKLILLLLLLLLPLSSGLIWTNTTFNNSLSTEDLIFSGNQNITRYLEIPEGLSLTKAFLNLTGSAVGASSTVGYYYELDESSGLNVPDSFSPTYDGTLTAQSNWITGRNGNGLYFNGTNNELITNEYPLMVANFTINIWVNLTNQTEAKDTSYGILTSVEGGSNRDGVVLEHHKTLGFLTTIYTANSGSFISEGAVTTNSSTWNMVTVTWNENQENLSLYKNGTIVSSVIIGGGLVAHDKNLTFGDSRFNKQDKFLGVMDEIAFFNETYNVTQVSDLYISGIGGDFPTNANIEIGTPDGDLEWNFTGSFTQTNNRTANLYQEINNYLSGCTYVGGICIVPFQFHSDSTGVLTYLDLLFSNDEVNEISNNFENSTIDTQREIFTINMSYDTDRFSLVTGSLIYNGTSYIGTPQEIGNQVVFTRTIDIPVVSSEVDKEFYWDFALTDDSGTIHRNSSFNNQTVVPSVFQLCGTGHPSINYTIRDEVTNALVISNFDATFDWKMNQSSEISKNVSVDLSVSSNYTFCVNLNETFYTEAKIELENTGYVTRKYNFLFEEFNATQQNMDLYVINNTLASNIIIEVKDSGLSPLEGYTVKIYRNQPATGNRVLVEQDATNVFGQIVAKLVQNDVDYDFEFYDTDNDLVKTVTKTNIACKTAICIIPYVIDVDESPFDDFDSIEGLDASLTFNNATNTFTLAWVDITGDNPTFRLEVTRYLLNGTTLVCNSTSTATSGSLTCPVGNQRASYTAYGFRSASPGEIFEAISVKVGDLSAIFGTEGLIWSFILLFSILAVGIFSPPIAMGLYLAGFLLMGITGIYYFSIPILVSHIVIASLFWWAFRG